MSRLFALVWLAVVVLAGGTLAVRLHHGLAFRTDLMALLPREAQNPALQQANDMVARALSQKIVLLVGAADRDQARAAAAELGHRLEASGLAELTTGGFDPDRLRQMGTLYFPYRQGLLAEDDRQRLQQGQGAEVALRALSQVYGFVGMTDAKLLRADPFLLMQSFFTGLPLPLSRLSLDEGMLSLRQDGTTWILVAGRLTGEPYALDVQKKLTETLDLDGLKASRPGLAVLRLGAVFFAQAGAAQAMGETSTIGLLSTLGTVLVVVIAFRALAPLGLSLLVIGVGVGTALAASLWAFGELHVGALLFGVSLIGVAVDYSLQYCTEIFAAPAPPADKLKRVFMGVSIGTATTVIGYLTLFLAPFPGLHQIAAFSAVGLVAAWLTVVLWLPRLDRARPPRHGARMLSWAGGFLGFWEGQSRWRFVLLGGLLVLGLAGLTRLHADDDVRRMQSLSPPLVAEQEMIQALIGATGGSQFFLVQGEDDETALRREEALVARLRPLVAAKALIGFQAPAQYVPSAQRQAENRRLVTAQLTPLMAEQAQRLGLAEPPVMSSNDQPLTLAEATGPLGFLSVLVLAPGTHVVSLDGVARLGEVAAAAEGIEGVRFIDPAGQFSALLAKYRVRALGLLALSALLMAPLLAWRYGLKRAAFVMAPPLAAVVLAPCLRALAGGAFTFFDAMALVLVLSVGVDYAVFCAETSGARKPVTMLAVALAASTALMSFGLLALSGVAAVQAFGTTMLLGILLAFLLAPLARRGLR
jgi:predicted exporter